MLKLSARPISRSIGVFSRRSVYTSVLESDINITKNGKVNVAVGAGGRSSELGTQPLYLVHLDFGPLCNLKLARHGTTTIVPFRDDMKKDF